MTPPNMEESSEKTSSDAMNQETSSSNSPTTDSESYEVTTESEDGTNSRTDELSSDLEANWSFILTDDNISTDYDVRSNSSSNEEHDKDAGAGFGPASGGFNKNDVISDTESESTTEEQGNKTSKRINSKNKTKNTIKNSNKEKAEAIEDSVSTIKTGPTDDSVIQFPDPINPGSFVNPEEEKQDAVTDATAIENLKQGCHLLKDFFPYVVLGLLIAARAFDLYLPLFKAASIDMLPSMQIFDDTGPAGVPLTVTKYETTTMTLFTAPNYDKQKTKDVYYEVVDGLPSWKLAQLLALNMLESAVDLGEFSINRAKDFASMVKEDEHIPAVLSYGADKWKNFMDGAVVALKGGTNIADSIAWHSIEAVKNSAEFFYKYDYAKNLQKANNHIQDDFKLAAKASASYYDSFKRSKVVKDCGSESSKFFQGVSSAFKIASRSAASSADLIWSSVRKSVSTSAGNLLSYDYSNMFKPRKAEASSLSNTAEEVTASLYDRLLHSDTHDSINQWFSKAKCYWNDDLSLQEIIGEAMDRYETLNRASQLKNPRKKAKEHHWKRDSFKGERKSRNSGCGSEKCFGWFKNPKEIQQSRAFDFLENMKLALGLH